MNLYDLSQPSKKKKQQLAMESRLAEFAADGGGDSGNYFQALASAWYNGTFDTGSLEKGIKSQQDVERLLNRGIVCPDGVTRKLHIDYNSDFNGVEIFSDDYYEHGDHDDTIDSRTGQKWGPYDHMEFSDDQLDEATGDQKFDSMMSQMTAEPKYPDQDMPPTSVSELIQWAGRNNKPYHEYFAQWARRNKFTNVNDALVWFGDNVDPSNPWGPKDFVDPFGRPAAEELEDAAKHDPKAAELMKVFRCYEEIVFDWPDEYRQMNMPDSRKGTDEGVAEGLNEFAPDGFNGGDDDEGFSPEIAKMAQEDGFTKGVSLADGATLERAMTINHWHSQHGGMYKQYFAKGFKEGRMNKVNHDNKQYNLNLKLMKDGSIRHGEQGVAEGAPELLKKEMPLHRHAEKLLAQNGVNKDDPDYHHHLGNTIKHLRQFGNIDLINKQGVEEGWKDTATLLGVPVIAGAMAVGAQHYDRQKPHVQVGGQNAMIVQYDSSRIPGNAMVLKGADGKMYKVWRQSGIGMNKMTLASPAEPVKEQGVAEGSEGQRYSVVKNGKVTKSFDSVAKAKDYAAKFGGTIKDNSKEQGVAEDDNSDVADISDSDYMRIKGIVDKKYPGYELAGLKQDHDGNIGVEIYHPKTHDTKELKTKSTSENKQGMAEGWTKLPSGDYQNSHTGVRTSKPPAKKKRGEKTGAEWDAIEKAKKEQGVEEGSDFDSAAFDRHMDKLRAQKELEKTDPMRAMVNKMKSDYDYTEKSKSKSKQDDERQITDPFHPSQGVNIGEHQWFDPGSLNELSPKTLGSYINKANKDVGTLGYGLGDIKARPGKYKDSPAIVKSVKHEFKNRIKGVEKAVNRLTKEQGVAEGAPISGDGGAVDNFKQQMANNTELAYQQKQQGMAEGSEEDSYSNKFVQSQIDYYKKHLLSGNTGDQHRIRGSLMNYERIKNQRIKNNTWQEQGVAEGYTDDIETTRQFKNAIAGLKAQSAINKAKDGAGAKYYADGSKVTPQETARRAAERKAQKDKKGMTEGGYQHGFADPTAPSLGGSRRKDDEGNPEFDDRQRRQTGMIFYKVDDAELAQQLGLKQTRAGKWYLRTGNRHAQQTADRAFGLGRIWYPESVEEAGVFGFMSNEPDKPAVKKPKFTLSQIRDMSKQEDEKVAKYVRTNDLPKNPNHMRVVHDDVELSELSNELLGRYKKELGIRASAADRAGNFDKGHEYFKKINRATVRQGDNDARRHAEKENDVMETRLNMMRKAGYDL